MCPRDTSPEAWKVFLDLQRQIPPAERLRRTLEYSEMIRQFAEAGLHARYPQAGERELFLRYAKQSLGTELFQRVYGGELADDGPSGQGA
jgi:hypothetical protein